VPLGDWFRNPSRAERLRAAGVRDDVVLAAERTAFGQMNDNVLLTLPGALSQDEVVLDLVQCRYARHTGLAVLTTGRVLFVPQDSRGQPMAIPLRDVQAVSSAMHRGMGALTLIRSGDEVVMDQILGNQAGTFADALGRAQAGAAAGVSSDRDPIDELIELRTMYRAGLVPDDEYRIRKQALVDRI